MADGERALGGDVVRDVVDLDLRDLGDLHVVVVPGLVDDDVPRWAGELG